MTREQINERLKEIENEISELENERDRLDHELTQIEKKEKAKRFKYDINHLSESNAVITYLDKNTRTTDLMDRFYHSEKEFLVFKDIFTADFYSNDFFIENKAMISLIVKKDNYPYRPYLSDGLTVTDLKLESGSWLDSRFGFGGRFRSLLKEIGEAEKKLSKMNKPVLFDNYIRLGAQIYANQTGFGSEYNGSELVWQGTLYGETTSFYIIGICVMM